MNLKLFSFSPFFCTVGSESSGQTYLWNDYYRPAGCLELSKIYVSPVSTEAPLQEEH